MNMKRLIALCLAAILLLMLPACGQKKTDSKPDDEEAQLLKITRHIMTDYQMEVVRMEIKEIEKQMQEPSVLESPEKLMDLQRRYKQLLSARAELSRIIGDRVVNL